MPVTNYYTVNGEIIGEETNGQRIDYLTDPLDSVTATIDQNAKVLNRYTYKPFGEVLSKTGTAPDPKFLWVGAHGYRQTGKKYAEVYVRARSYDTNTGRWTSRDPLWPKESAYGYVGGRVTCVVDASGTYTVMDCTDRTRDYCDYRDRHGGSNNWGVSCFCFVSGEICRKLIRPGPPNLLSPGPGPCAGWADCMNECLWKCWQNRLGCDRRSRACWGQIQNPDGTPRGVCADLSKEANRIACCKKNVECEQTRYSTCQDVCQPDAYLIIPCPPSLPIILKCCALMDLGSPFDFRFCGGEADRIKKAQELCCDKKVWRHGTSS